MRYLYLLAIGIALAAPGLAAAHEADRYTIACLQADTEDACKADAVEIRTLYEKAYKGDYQARRNLAWMLQNGSAGVRKDVISACSWRMIITTSKSRKVDQSDFDNMNFVCGKLTPQQVSQAKIQGSTLIRRMAAKDPIDKEVIDVTGLDSTAEPLQ